MQEGEFSLVDDLDPQVKTLLESFQAMAAQQLPPDHILSNEEKIAASRQMVRDAVGLGIPSDVGFHRLRRPGDNYYVACRLPPYASTVKEQCSQPRET